MTFFYLKKKKLQCTVENFVITLSITLHLLLHNYVHTLSKLKQNESDYWIIKNRLTMPRFHFESGKFCYRSIFGIID